MKQRDVKLLLASVAAGVFTHLVVEAFKTRRELIYRHAAGESDYERTHPKPRRCKGGCKKHGTPTNPCGSSLRVASHADSTYRSGCVSSDQA